jgi:hypothetical protein
MPTAAAKSAAAAMEAATTAVKAATAATAYVQGLSRRNSG